MSKVNYKILEKNGKFLAGYMRVRYRFLWFWKYEEFQCLYKGIYDPAHFDTLKEARNFLIRIMKPEVYLNPRKTHTALAYGM